MDENKKEKKIVDPRYLQYEAISKQANDNTEKLKEFMERIAPFAEVKTLDEARELAKKILPTANEINRFYIGDAKCTIINKEDMFRVSVDGPSEFVSYNFE